MNKKDNTVELTLQPTFTTLVDHVEDSLLTHFKSNNFHIGDPIPNEKTLAEQLGVARSVLRECLSRLKMLGMINSRPRKGMVLAEPTILGGMKRVIDPRFLSEETVRDLLEFRIALEIGISYDIFEKITPDDIKELDEIVRIGKMIENNEYAVASETSFHTKLYKITGNKTIAEFQDIIHPVLTFIKQSFCKELSKINQRLQKEGLTASHADLLVYLKNGDREGYKAAIERHFQLYRIFLREHPLQNGDTPHSLV
ncbi:MAG: GntR family transcriptional regulator [Muribaculaceae bacterium]|nr:FadR family transcriptional regulator [Bacteroidales bacterium]MDE6072744.1 GntR family transcriptional regulator [Muribaculaceae bacterium]